jgi:hypothetical protein
MFIYLALTENQNLDPQSIGMIERIANHYITVDVLAIGKRWCRLVWPR